MNNLMLAGAQDAFEAQRFGAAYTEPAAMTAGILREAVQPLTADDVMNAAATWSSCYALAHGTNPAGVAWLRADRACTELQRVTLAYGKQCAATGSAA